MADDNLHAGGAGWMSRSEVAKALGVSTTMVRKYERAGTLPSIREKGRAFYATDAVEQLRQEREARKLERENGVGAQGATSTEHELDGWQAEEAAWARLFEQQRQRRERERERDELDRIRRQYERLERRVRLLSLVRERPRRSAYPPSSGYGDALLIALPVLLAAGAAYLATRTEESAPSVPAPPPRRP